MSETTNVMNSEVVKRLLCYVSYDTQSKDESSEVPSTQKQFDLAKVLKKELEEIGASDVRLSDHCYVYAKIPSNLDKKVPAIGFIAHMDTSPALSGKDIRNFAPAMLCGKFIMSLVVSYPASDVVGFIKNPIKIVLFILLVFLAWKVGNSINTKLDKNN